MTVSHGRLKPDMQNKEQRKDSTTLHDAEDNKKTMSISDLLVSAVDRIIREENPFKHIEQPSFLRVKNATRLNRHELNSTNKAVDVFWNSDERRQLSKHKEEVSKRILQARGDYSDVSPYVKRHEIMADLLGILPLRKEKSVEGEVPNDWKRRIKRRKIYRDISDWGLSDEEDNSCDPEMFTSTPGSPKEIHQNIGTLNLVSHTKESMNTPKDLSNTDSLRQTSLHKEKNIQTRDFIQSKSNSHFTDNCGITINDNPAQYSTLDSSRQEVSVELQVRAADNLRQENVSNKQSETTNHEYVPKDNSQLTTKDILEESRTHPKRATLYNLQLEKLNNLRKSTSGETHKGASNNPSVSVKEIVQSKVTVVREEDNQSRVKDFSEQRNTCGFQLKDQEFNTLRDMKLHPKLDENVRLHQTCSLTKDREFYNDTEKLDEVAIHLILDTLLRAQRHFKDVVPSLNPGELKLNIEKYMREKQKNMAEGETICTEQEATKVLLMEHIVKFFEAKIIEIVKFAKSIPGFRDLSIEDQANLIKVSRIESAMVSGLPGVNTRTGLVTTDNNGELPLNLLGSVISPTFLHEFVKIGRKIENAQVTEKEAAILRGMTLTFSDRCQLKEPKRVERIQKKLVMCLQYVLERETTTVSPSVRMGQLFDILTSLRNYTDVDSSMLEGCIQAYPNNHNDLVREFLNRDIT